MHLLQHRHGSRAQQLCSYSSDLELNRCHFTFDYSKKWWGKYKKTTWERWRDICYKYDKCVTTDWVPSASWGCIHARSLVTDANPQLSGSKTAQHHTPIMEISHKWGWGGVVVSRSLSLSCTPCFHGNSTDRNYDWLKLLSEIQAEMYVEFPVQRCYAVMESLLCLPLVYGSQAEVSCCCPAKQSQL